MSAPPSSLASAHGRTIAVIGLGYVGLPVAVAFAKAGTPTIGFDINTKRVETLRAGYDETREVSTQALQDLVVTFTDDPQAMSSADFFIVTVPTPIDAARRPDLGALAKASTSVGRVLRKGGIVVYESTVYPGATEEFCVPILQQVSGLRAGQDFWVGYSPERINPGDTIHRFETIQKVVSAQDAGSLEIVAQVYETVVKAGVFRASSIKVAEAAKVIENTQRDLNIALMNELSHIFHLLDIDTADVLAAAGTKWNFLPFTPGLVGGHCIGVDPYYLTHRAEIAGYHPQVILAGRRINDGVGAHIAQECLRLLMRRGVARPRIAVLGLTFKENVPDIRNSKVMGIINALTAAGAIVTVHDPHASSHDAEAEYGVKLSTLAAMAGSDAVILAVAHREYVEAGWSLVQGCLNETGGVVIDVKAKLDQRATPKGVVLWRL